MNTWPQVAYWPVPELLSLLLEAGRRALDHQYQVTPEAKADGSLVTVADREIESLFAETLDQPGTGWYMIGEETEAAESRTSDYLSSALDEVLFIVDPIDGTAPFANGLPTWGISLGCAYKGTLVEGAVYLPRAGKLYISAGADVYLLRIRNDQIVDRTLLQPTPAAVGPLGMIAVSQDLTKNGRLLLPNPVQALGTAVVPMTELLHGHYLAYSGKLKLWDLAGGWPMLHKAGFKAILHDGTELPLEISPDFYELRPGQAGRWKLLQPCIFAAPGVAAYVLGNIQEG